MKRSLIRLLPFLLAALTLGLPSAFAQTTERVSVDSGGIQGNGESETPSISSDSRFVAFMSFASNLVPGDTNGALDIFVHDRETGQTTRVSMDSAGLQGNDDSLLPSISANGRFVAFMSEASNLVPGDTNGRDDVFVHDRRTGLTQRVSVDSAGVQGVGYADNARISSDGRFVAFRSSASNLVPGDSNLERDIFVHDRQTSQTTRVSVDSAGLQGNAMSWAPSISSDGRFVAYVSYASNLVPLDTNNTSDIFVHDRQTGQTTRVSVDSGGHQGNSRADLPTISSTGRFVSFSSSAFNLVPGDTNDLEDVFVHDRQTGQTTRVSVNSGGGQGVGNSGYGSNGSSISFDGRFVAFESYARNLVTYDRNYSSDIFVHDRQTAQTTWVSVDPGGLEGNSDSYRPSISSDGRFVAFASGATNLVPGETNGFIKDIFVRDRGAIGPRLELTGTCPGPIMLAVRDATAHGKVAIACGAAGNFTRTVTPCAGILLGVTPPVLRVI